MAKKKLTAKQRKARKRAAYIRAEYYKNYDALDYLRNFAKVKDIKIPSKITKKSLESIRKIYKKARAEAEKTGIYVDITTGEVLTKLPTKREMVKQVREEPTQQYRRYRAQPEEATFNPDEQYIEEIKSKIASLSPKEDSTKSATNYNKNVKPKLEQASSDWISMIDDAIAQYGTESVANALASNGYMQRIANIEEKYAFEIIESIEDSEADGLVPLMDATLEDVMYDTLGYT